MQSETPVFQENDEALVLDLEDFEMSRRLLLRRGKTRSRDSLLSPSSGSFLRPYSTSGVGGSIYGK